MRLAALTIVALLLIVVPAAAQETVTVALTAEQVYALKLFFGTDVTATAAIKALVERQTAHYLDEARRKDEQALRDALVQSDAQTRAAVRKLLRVPVPESVVTEQAARSQAEKQAAVERAVADHVKALLAACEAKRPAIDCSFIR